MAIGRGAAKQNTPQPARRVKQKTLNPTRPAPNPKPGVVTPPTNPQPTPGVAAKLRRPVRYTPPPASLNGKPAFTSTPPTSAQYSADLSAWKQNKRAMRGK